MGFFKKLKEGLLPINRRALKKEIAKQNEHIDRRLDMLFKKMSMQNDIWEMSSVRFFVPNYPLDFIQSIIVDSSKFYEQDILEDLSQFMPKDPVICDIGSNIGNHTLYWLTHQNAQFVYCFEPRFDTFKILEKNIQINAFEKQVECFNIALSDKDGNLSTNSFRSSNIGANSYKEDNTGTTMMTPLDQLGIARKIDFMKIDVEGMECSVLKGAKETIQNNLPVIFIESCGRNFEEAHSLLTDMQYKMVKEYPNYNYLFLSTL